MKIRIGLPRAAMNGLADEAESLGAPVLISMGSFFDAGKSDFRRIGMVPWHMDAALDSAGFTSMLQGGYRWTVHEHVEFVATNSAKYWSGSDAPTSCELPFPWAWWAAMDYCCEEEIAENRDAVELRMRLTIDSYRETLETVAEFWGEGFNWLSRPMPTLQGRTVADYLWSARELSKVWMERPLDESEEDHDGTRYPALIGLGSVCGREVHGPNGILAILDALHRELPNGVKLHLFGVKGDALPYLWAYDGRIESVDSMAWDTDARMTAARLRKANGAMRPGDEGFVSCDIPMRRAAMKKWWMRQQVKVGKKEAVQKSLF